VALLLLAGLAVLLVRVAWRRQSSPAEPIRREDGRLTGGEAACASSISGFGRPPEALAPGLTALDPGETESAISPFMVLYAIHDALVKPMPAGPMTPCCGSSSWGARSGS
jgi:hypothetical protein